MKLFAFIVLLISLSHTAGAISLRDLKWKQLSQDDGITVFTPLNFSHESGMVPIKFHTTLDHSVLKVLSVLADEKRKVEWVPKTKVVKIIERKSLRDFVVYYRYHAPWPFKDRDFIIRNLASVKDGQILVQLKSQDHANDPATGDTVRGFTYDGYTIIRPLGPKKTYLEMGLLSEFGGFIPKWIINLVQKKWPYGFMSRLKTQLDKPDIEILEQFKALTSQGIK